MSSPSSITGTFKMALPNIMWPSRHLPTPCQELCGHQKSSMSATGVYPQSRPLPFRRLIYIEFLIFLTKQFPSQVEYYIILKHNYRPWTINISITNIIFMFKLWFHKGRSVEVRSQTFRFTNGKNPVLSRYNDLKLKDWSQAGLPVNITVKY